MYLTVSQYNLFYGLQLNPNQVIRFEAFVRSIQKKINNYTQTQFEITANLTKKIRIDQCHSTYIKIGAWQDNLNFSCKLLNKDLSIVKTLVKNIDYQLEYSFDNSCIVALNFTCSDTLLDKCAFLEITGDYGWSVAIPDDLYLSLLYMAKTNLNTIVNNNSYGYQRILTSERSMTMSRAWSVQPDIANVGKQDSNRPFTEDDLEFYRNDMVSSVYSLDDNCKKNSCC